MAYLTTIKSNDFRSERALPRPSCRGGLARPLPEDFCNPPRPLMCARDRDALRLGCQPGRGAFFLAIKGDKHNDIRHTRTERDNFAD